jgi:hypothetical protein
MRRWWATVALALTALAPRPAHAVWNATDLVPAATLLYPYFEVDPGDENGVTTLIAIQNASASAAMGRVTLWTDLGLPTLAFDVYFTGFDTQTIDLRDVLVDGVLPVTADDGDDPGDTGSPDTGISNQGPFSQDINFPCTMPVDPMPFANPVVTGARLTDLGAAHRGQEAAFFFGPGKCGGHDHGDGRLRGYVTVDSVVQCLGAGTPPHPAGAGYFEQTADRRNILLGDWFLVDPANDRMEADVAVHVEGTYNNGQPLPFGTPTFYGGLNSVAGAATDFREPLATTWAASFQGGRSELLVWRDPARETASFTCGAPPAFFPLGHNQVVAFDMESSGTPIVGEPFPFRTGAYTLVGADGPKAGWAYLNLNTSLSGQRFFTKQSWVTVRRQLESGGVMSGAASAVPLGHQSADANVILIPNP